MPRLTNNLMRFRTNHQRLWPRGEYVKGLLLLLLAGTMTLVACGSSGTSSGGSKIPITLSGNWQFTMAEQLNPDPNGLSFVGGLQGGFLLQNNSAVAGTATYSFSPAPSAIDPDPIVCNSGPAALTGTISGQSVSLTAVANNQTLLTLTGTLSPDGLTMAGSYTSTNGAGCGIISTQGWSAILVPPLTGSIQGTFHSAGGVAGLNEQDFQVSGALTQAANTGAAATAVTGDLSFLDPTTNLSDYRCFGAASVSGQISGNTVSLQILGSDGSTLGQIGEPTGSTTGLSPVTLNSAPGGSFLQGVGTTYLVATTAGPCTGSPGSTITAGDFGNICLALNGASACQQPVTLAPSALTFPAKVVGTTSTQTVALTNTSGTTLNDVTLTLTNNSVPGNFAETDACGIGGATSGGEPFYLIPTQSCVIKVIFTPAEICGNSALCLTATLTVNSPINATIFTIAIPISGTGVSAIAASTPSLDFGTGFSEPSLPQLLRITNRSGHPSQTLSSSSIRPFQDAEYHAEID